MKNNTPQQFALQLGSLISLYLSLSFLLVLLFGLISLLFPDAAEQYYAVESVSSSVRIGIAMVVVFFPTYLILTRLVNRMRRRENNNQYLSLTKWLIYLSLLVGVLTLLVDLVVVLNYFLEGDLTTRFIFKAVSVLVVIGAAVHYYILDARGFWTKNEDKSIMYAIGASIIVVVAVVYGFTSIATPSQVREQKLDAKQISDLQMIQSKIEEYMGMSSSTLPTTLTAAYGEFPVPTAPEARPDYIYELTDRGFKLCATFATDMQNELNFGIPMPDKSRPVLNENDWQYKAGNFCFERIVNK